MGINLKEANISHYSDERLWEFYRTLDEHKLRIFVKAPSSHPPFSPAFLSHAAPRLSLWRSRNGAAAGLPGKQGHA